MDRLSIEPGTHLGELGRYRTKRVTCVRVVVRLDPGSLYGISAMVYFERISEDHRGRYFRKAYDGIAALNFARKLDLALRQTYLSVIPGLGIRGTVPLRTQPYIPGHITHYREDQPWQYTMSLDLNTVPKHLRTWDPDKGAWVESKGVYNHGKRP